MSVTCIVRAYTPVGANGKESFYCIVADVLRQRICGDLILPHGLLGSDTSGYGPPLPRFLYRI